MPFFACRQFIGNIHKQNYNENKSCRYLSKSINFPEIHFSNLPSIKTVIIKKIIPKERSSNKIKKSYKLFGNVKFDPIKGIANQAADRLIDKSERAFNQARYLFFFTKIMLSFSGRQM